MFTSGQIFLFMLFFVVLTGACASMGAAILAYTFGICAFLTLCAAFLRYLNGQ